MGFRDNKEIIEKIRQAIPEMKNMEYPMKRIGIFGSVLKGTDIAESDLDVLVEFITINRDEQVLGAIDIEERLKEFLQHTDVRVSAFPLNGAKPEVRNEIIETVFWIVE